MSKFLLFLTMLGVTAAANAQYYGQSAPAIPPQPQPASVHYGWAEVLRVDPVYAVVSPPPRQECYPQTVTRTDTDHTGGTVIGAIVGGVLGNTVGKGDGRKAATVAGAVVGGALGNRAAAANEQTYTTQQTVCRPVDGYAPQQQVVAYEVEYRYRGEVYMSRLAYDPGERLRVRITVTPTE